MTQYHNYTITDVDNLTVFERDIHVELLKAKIKKEEEQAHG